MPAINVARTDTFEQQRVKINEIGNQVFSVTQGGSDLATGNLKLGDGLRTAPSLAFTSDPTLGIYKPQDGYFGYVYSGRKLLDISPETFISYQDIVLQQKIIDGSTISLNSGGANYDPGSYSNISLTGGTGFGALANINVDDYSGTITNSGANYTPGSYILVPLSGGNGTGAEVSFVIDDIGGDILDAGNGYIPGVYPSIPLTGGSGTGAEAEVTITGTTSITTTFNAGTGYTDGSYSSVLLFNEPTQIFAVTVIANPGSAPPDNVYQIDGNTQPTLSLIKGNTYWFDVSDASNAGHPFVLQLSDGSPLPADQYAISQNGSGGNSGSFIELVIKPDATESQLKYDCTLHPNMGAGINLSTGTLGDYGNGAVAQVDVSSGSVTNFTIITAGDDYKTSDILRVGTDILGSGNGFSATISNITYDGIVSAITVTDPGQNYAIDDVLSFSNTSVGGTGSGFSYTVTTNPGILTEITFSQYGTGYQINDVLFLPEEVTNVSASLNGSIDGLTTTLSTGSTNITVSDTSGISAGMLVFTQQGSTGTLDPATVVQNVISSTIIELSLAPTGDGAATLSFNTQEPASSITLPSTAGIFVGYEVVKLSGDGVLDTDTTVTSVDTNTNLIGLSANALTPGPVVLEFVPPYGKVTQRAEYTIQNLGVVSSVTLADGGIGYSELDDLSVNAFDLTQNITYLVTNKNLQTLTFNPALTAGTISVGDEVRLADRDLVTFTEDTTPTLNPTTVGPLSSTLSNSSATITVSNTSGISTGMRVLQDPSDTGLLDFNTTVLSVDSATDLTLSLTPIVSGAANLTFATDESATYNSVASTSSGDGTGATFNVVRSPDGAVATVQLSSAGNFYLQNDTITISGSDLGGSSPTHDIVLTVSSVLELQNSTVYETILSGSDISGIRIDAGTYVDGGEIYIPDSGITTYTVDTASTIQYRFFLDVGSGEEYNPSITLYSGNTYNFDFSDTSNSGHVFSLSKYRDGIWGPSYIENVSTTLDVNNSTITVADTTGILPGMVVEVTAGSGELVGDTFVESVPDSTSVVITKEPQTSGSATLSFRGVEYTDSVTRSGSNLLIRISDTTPNLYYYCATPSADHANEGGFDNEENALSVDTNNPKTFGSGLSVTVNDISSTDVVSLDINTGKLKSSSFETQSAVIETATFGTSLTSPDGTIDALTCSSITSSATLALTSTDFNIVSDVSIGTSTDTKVTIQGSTGDITTAGILKTTNSINVNDKIIITDNDISTTSGNDILLSPATGRVAKVNTTSAITIPAGTTAQRPTSGIVEDGSIRFNTESGQYEGYSAATSSWSSLGGVRDLDGNTYIAAEASVGANDNTLYFYNDGNNTVSVTPNYLQFVNVKKIRSINTTAPAYTDYATNTQVNVGDYVKYRNNIYEVTQSGQTGTSGNEPTHTSGAATNGTAELTWFTTAIAPITFEETEEVRIDPLGFTDLVVNAELRFSNNVISTDLNDLIVRPNTGKKVTIDTNTSLVLPVGDTNQRGVATQGSVRFNTTNSTYEGYDGTNWGSLGGVKDVDQNTYIIPELSAGSDENILYFYNNGTNTMRLSESALDFTNIDTITTQNSNLDIQAETVTFNNVTATIDASSGRDSTFIHTTKDNLDFGLSVGINVDPLLRLDNNGDIYVNKAFGTGSFDGLKLISSSFDSFELIDLRIDTQDIQLIKGGTNSGAATLYDPTNDTGSRVTVSIHNQTTGDKEMIEYHVIDKGSDIYHTDISNLNTGTNLVTSVFDFDAQNNVRVTFTLTDLTIGDVVNITVVSNTFKK